VDRILDLRCKSDQEIADIFEKDQHVLVNALYEWDYYSSKILSSAGIVTRNEGKVICKLKHGTSTFRTLKKNYFEINTDLMELYHELNNNYSPFDTPMDRSESTRLRFDIDKEIYAFFPSELLEHIGESSQNVHNIEELLALPKLINQYSNNTDGEECYLFEDVLTDGFNMFYNVEAQKIGGAGNTDVECLFIRATDNKKFAVDAKSTKSKLTSINAGRLAAHRKKIGGEYTIVVPPRYVPAVKHDIVESQTVILLASTFSEYLYNCINSNIREIDYTPFDKIITENLGKDISKQVSELTFKQFAA